MDWLSWSKPLVATILLVVLWAIESAAPMCRGRRHRMGHGLANLELALVNTLAVALPFATLMYGATEWAADRRFGLVRLVELPAWANWGLVLVLFDAGMYAWHRLNHRVALLCRFHAVHHTDREMDATSAFRFHPGEIALSFMARLLVLPVLGMTMPQLLAYETLLLPVILFHHSNVRIPRRVDSILRWLIVTPIRHLPVPVRPGSHRAGPGRRRRRRAMAHPPANAAAPALAFGGPCAVMRQRRAGKRANDLVNSTVVYQAAPRYDQGCILSMLHVRIHRAESRSCDRAGDSGVSGSLAGKKTFTDFCRSNTGSVTSSNFLRENASHEDYLAGLCMSRDGRQLAQVVGHWADSVFNLQLGGGL